MNEDKIVQFMYFETTLDREEFIKRWEKYSRSENSDLDVTLQQSGNKELFKYISQHRCTASGLQFVFMSEGRSARNPQVAIKAKSAGGYSILQEERINDTLTDESKVFAFIIKSQPDLNVYKLLSSRGKLNIYEAYYENCRYTYILEFFVKNKYVSELLVRLKQYDAVEVGIYKECVLQAV